MKISMSMRVLSLFQGLLQISQYFQILTDLHFFGYMYFSEAVLHDVVLLVPFSACSLQVYRRATGICPLTSVDAISLKACISPKGSLEESIGSLTHQIISSVNRDSITRYILFIFHWFLSLLALAKTSSTMLSKHEESSHSCFFISGEMLWVSV